MGGTPQGAGTDCTSVECAPRQACYDPDHAGPEVPVGDCLASGSVLQGDGLTCDANPCGGHVPCPPGGRAESEVGGELHNSGCLVDTPVFERLEPVMTDCGTVVAEGGTRDFARSGASRAGSGRRTAPADAV